VTVCSLVQGGSSLNSVRVRDRVTIRDGVKNKESCIFDWHLADLAVVDFECGGPWLWQNKT